MPIDDRRHHADGEHWSAGGDASHLDTEIMAAYAEGTLTPDERQRVYRHMTACDRCRETLSDLTSFVAEENAVLAPAALPFRRRRWVVAAAAALGAAAMIVLAIGGRTLNWFGGNANGSGLRELVVAYAGESTRPAEGRLSVDFPYAPAPTVNRGSTTRDVSPDVRIAASRIEATAQNSPPPEVLHALGIARLTIGDLEGAVSALQAAGRSSDAAAVQTDLAAAYLERGRHRASADDIQKALDAANRALATTPQSPAALFNRAVSLDELRRTEEAAAAWRSFIAAEHDPQWIAEASRRQQLR